MSSVSCCPPCSDVEVVVRGGEGAAHISHPSGITIILQPECHALQTADKKKNVTTAGWWRRDRGERDGKNTAGWTESKGRRNRNACQQHPRNQVYVKHFLLPLPESPSQSPAPALHLSFTSSITKSSVPFFSSCFSGWDVASFACGCECVAHIMPSWFLRLSELPHSQQVKTKEGQTDGRKEEYKSRKS